MGIKTVKKSNADKTNSNEDFTIEGLVFPSYYLYLVLETINVNLSLFYIETEEEGDYEPIYDTYTRFSDFDEAYDNVMISISTFKDIYKNDARVRDFLYNNRLSNKFSSLFRSIYKAFIEAMSSGDNFDNQIEEMRDKKNKENCKKIISLWG